MNHIAPRPGEDGQRLLIEVVFDLVCPWCYLGVARLMRMLDNRPEAVVEIQWRPFLLNPDIAPGGVPRQDYLVRKFGGEDRARRLHGSITELGRAEGLAFRFDAIRRVPHTLDAHRMVRWAARHGAADHMVLALFAAHFCEGRDIAHHEVLAAIAHGLGRLVAETAKVGVAHGGGGGAQGQSRGQSRGRGRGRGRGWGRGWGGRRGWSGHHRRWRRRKRHRRGQNLRFRHSRQGGRGL